MIWCQGKILSHFVPAPLQRSSRNPKNISSICSHIRVVQDCMSVIQNDIPLQISSLATIMPQDTMYSIRWDSMLLVCLLRTMRSRQGRILLSRHMRISEYLPNNSSRSDFPMTGIVWLIRRILITTDGHSGYF